MSEAYDRGKNFELEVAKVLRKKLNAKVMRDSRSGAGINKADIKDYYNEIPLHMELKDQETLKVKEWFRQAADSAPFTKAPALIFRTDEDILATLRFTDLVNFLVEIADLRAEVDDLRKPTEHVVTSPIRINSPAAVEQFFDSVKGKKPKDRIVKTDSNGHITDEYGYCNQKGCKFNRSYRAPKVKK